MPVEGDRGCRSGDRGQCESGPAEQIGPASRRRGGVFHGEVAGRIVGITGWDDLVGTDASQQHIRNNEYTQTTRR